MATNSGIKVRLESIPAIQGKHTYLNPTQVQEVSRGVHSRFFDEGELKSHLQVLSRQLDISDVDPDEVKRFLLSLQISRDEKVWIVWCSTETGISMLFRDFVQYYDDLWYPSSDDMWVTGKSLTWLLDFYHEEIVTFTKLPARSV